MARKSVVPVDTEYDDAWLTDYWCAYRVKRRSDSENSVASSNASWTSLHIPQIDAALS